MDVAKRRLDPEADPGPIRFGTSRPSLRSNPVIARREGRRALPEGAKRALEEGRAFGRPPAHDDDNVATLMAWGGEPAVASNANGDTEAATASASTMYTRKSRADYDLPPNALVNARTAPAYGKKTVRGDRIDQVLKFQGARDAVEERRSAERERQEKKRKAAKLARVPGRRRRLPPDQVSKEQETIKAKAKRRGRKPLGHEVKATGAGLPEKRFVMRRFKNVRSKIDNRPPAALQKSAGSPHGSPAPSRGGASPAAAASNNAGGDSGGGGGSEGPIGPRSNSALDV